LTAALMAQESGVALDKILMVQKLRLGDANSKMSQGGIQAATDLMIAQLDISSISWWWVSTQTNPNLVEVLVKEGPEVIKWHESLRCNV